MSETQYPLWLKLASCMIYGFASAALTFVNKSIYERYKFSSPLDLLFTQCCFNVGICLTMMSYKSLNPKAFSLLEEYGMKISSLGEAFGNISIGGRMGAFNLVTVLFGLYSVKLVNIPLFLTFRRCAILATVILNIIVQKKYPDQKLIFSTSLIVTGACIAGYETFDSDMFGYFLIWMNNISQSLYNIYVQSLNKDKKVTPFQINFFFALVGLPVSLAVVTYNGEIQQLIQIKDMQNFTDQMTLIFMLSFSGMMGIVITLGVLLVCTTCNPIAVNITGTIKDVVLTYAGFVFFENVHISFSVMVGLFFSFAGATFYGYDSYSKIQQPQPAPAKTVLDPKLK